MISSTANNGPQTDCILAFLSRSLLDLTLFPTPATPQKPGQALLQGALRTNVEVRLVRPGRNDAEFRALDSDLSNNRREGLPGYEGAAQ